MKNVNKSLCYVGPILKVISCLDYANVLLCNYAGIQVMMTNFDSGMDLYYCYINLISRLQLDYIIMHMHLFTMYYYHKCFNCNFF